MKTRQIKLAVTVATSGLVLSVAMLSNALAQSNTARFDTSLPTIDNAVQLKIGTGTREVTVFMDTRESFSRKLLLSLSRMEDVRVKVLLVGVMSAKDRSDAQSVWCSAKPGDTLLLAMLSNTEMSPVAGACDTGFLAKNLSTFQTMRVPGLPHLMFPNGTSHEGIPKSDDDLAQLIAAGQTGARSSSSVSQNRDDPKTTGRGARGG